MAARLSALRTGRALLPETLPFCFWYSFLSGAGKPQDLVRLEGLGKLKKFTSSGLEPATFRMQILFNVE
jgi:hypothetical protein